MARVEGPDESPRGCIDAEVPCRRPGRDGSGRMAGRGAPGASSLLLSSDVAVGHHRDDGDLAAGASLDAIFCPGERTGNRTVTPPPSPIPASTARASATGWKSPLAPIVYSRHAWSRPSPTLGRRKVRFVASGTIFEPSRCESPRWRLASKPPQSRRQRPAVASLEQVHRSPLFRRTPWLFPIFRIHPARPTQGCCSQPPPRLPALQPRREGCLLERSGCQRRIRSIDADESGRSHSPRPSPPPP